MRAKSLTTHTYLNGSLVLYRRERSSIWQCRYKVAEHWQRITTRKRELPEAVEAATHLLISAEIRRRENLPVVTRRVRDIAKLAIQRMRDETMLGNGKVSFDDYIRVINDYIVPCLGRRNISNLDADALSDLDAYRVAMMGKAPAQSTVLTHNAALNRVLDEAEVRGFLTEATRPKLQAKGAKAERRSSFKLKEVRKLMSGWKSWIAEARNAESVERRELMRDYVAVLLDTGARPGKELTDLQWRHVTELHDVVYGETRTVIEQDEREEEADTALRHALELSVSGKTGRRSIVARKPTFDALVRIAKRNYPSRHFPVLERLKEVAHRDNKDFVFRTRDGSDPSSSFQKMFADYLRKMKLQIDPETEQKRVFYSLRHTYATLSLTHDKVPIHTLAKQMGTSVLMIEKHYSHLDAIKAIDQLRGEESRALLAQKELQ